jgi:hypothetical protein
MIRIARSVDHGDIQAALCFEVSLFRVGFVDKDVGTLDNVLADVVEILGAGPDAPSGELEFSK